MLITQKNLKKYVKLFNNTLKFDYNTFVLQLNTSQFKNERRHLNGNE